MNDDHVRPETYGQMERRLKRELAAAQADAKRLRGHLDEIIEAAKDSHYADNPGLQDAIHKSLDAAQAMTEDDRIVARHAGHPNAGRKP